MTKTNIDYSKTIIYKIVCNDLNVTEIYVGHTTNFTKRKYSHKNSCVNEKNELYDLKIYQTIRQNGGWDNWSMIEIEKYPSSDGNEARARERFWFEELQANLNMQYPNRSLNESKKASDKKYYDKNKESLLLYQKQYADLNKDKLKDRRKAYYEKTKDTQKEKNKEYRKVNKDKIKECASKPFNCECGSTVRWGDKADHFKTIKHQKFCEQIN